MTKFFVKVGLIQILIMFMFTFLDQMHKFYLRDYKGSSVIKLTNMERNSGGTGFGVQYKGYKFIMTNSHVCEIRRSSPSGFWVNKPDGTLVRAVIIKQYEKHDLCILKHVEGIHTLSLGSDPRIGETHYIVGHPALQPKTLTTGEYVGMASINVIIADAPSPAELNCKKGKVHYRPFFGAMCIRTYIASFTTTPILGGSSGSPVVNSFGNLVGVAFASNERGNNWAKLVPLYSVRDFLEEYISRKERK